MVSPCSLCDSGPRTGGDVRKHRARAAEVTGGGGGGTVGASHLGTSGARNAAWPAAPLGAASHSREMLLCPPCVVSPSSECFHVASHTAIMTVTL